MRLHCFPPWLLFFQSCEFSSSRPIFTLSRSQYPQRVSKRGQKWTIKSLQLIKHSLISSTTLTPPSIWMMLTMDFVFVWWRLCNIAHHREEILPRGKKKALHLAELITVNFTGNKVCRIHSYVAIDQDGNKWLIFNLLQRFNQSISWYSLFLHKISIKYQYGRICNDTTFPAGHTALKTDYCTCKCPQTSLNPRS